nr:putative transposase for insertion sequence element [uncultured bacterium]
MIPGEMLGVLTSHGEGGPTMQAEYDGRQIVDMDRHRYRSVLVRMSQAGEQLDVVRIDNDPIALGRALSQAGESPEVVLEATYGWYWAVDVLTDCGASVHLAPPLGIKGFAYRRVKNDVRDAADLADLLRLGWLPEAYVAPPEVRELRELVRHGAKLVAWRSALKASVHAVLAKQGLHLAVADLFGVGGRQLLATAPLHGPYRGPGGCLLPADRRRGLRGRRGRQSAAGSADRPPRLPRDPGHPRRRTTLAAVFTAEIGQADRFASAAHLASWAGLTPRHRESDTVVRRGGAARADHQAGSRPGALGRGRGRPEDPGQRGRAGEQPGPSGRTPRPQHRHRRGGPQAPHAGLLRAARRAHPRPARPRRGVSEFGRDRMRDRAGV